MDPTSSDTAKNARRPVIDGCTCYKARRLARALIRLYDREMASTGLTVGQFSILRNLAPRPIKTGAFALELGVERTTLTRNLRPLIDAGLIALSRGTDARTRLLTLTDKGRTVMRESRANWRRMQCQIEDTLGATSVAALHDMLDSVLATIGRDLEPSSHETTHHAKATA